MVFRRNVDFLSTIALRGDRVNLLRAAGQLYPDNPIIAESLIQPEIGFRLSNRLTGSKVIQIVDLSRWH